MFRYTPALVVLALFGCRDDSVQDVNTLQLDVNALTDRIAALEEDNTAKTASIAALEAELGLQATGLADLEADVYALADIDITDTLDALDAVDTRIDAIEGMDLATETWVRAEGYAAGATVAALDSRIVANTGGISSNSSLITSNSSTLSTQLAAVLDNTSAIGLNTVAIGGFDARASIVESGLIGAAADVTRMDAAMVVLDGQVTSLDDDVEGLSTDVTAAGVRMDGFDTDIGDVQATSVALRGDIDTNTGLLSTAQDDILATASQVSATEADIANNASSIGDNASSIGDNASSIGDNASSIGDNAGALGGYGSQLSDLATDVDSQGQAIASNQSSIVGNTSSIGDNSGGISGNASSIDDNASSIGDVQSDLAGSGTEVDDLMDRLGLVEILNDRQWVAANTSNGTNSGPITQMVLTYTKQLADTMMYAQYDDNLRTNGSGQGCRWEIRFNGESCTSPGKVAADVYVSSQNSHKPHSVIGYCRATASGAFVAGEVTASVHVMSSPGYNNADCSTGWQGDQLGVLQLEEVVDPNL